MEEVIESEPLVSGSSRLIIVDEKTQIGGARRAAITMGAAHGLKTDALGRLALIVTEAATNIVAHASHGAMVLRALTDSLEPQIEMLALDQGPGIADVRRAMENGYSTAGTAGEGLGAMRRKANLFEIYTQRGNGTAVLARVSDAPKDPQVAASARASLDDILGVICVPVHGERECGDAWRIAAGSQRLSLMVVDGLGHGSGAAESAAAVTAVFPQVRDATPTAAMARFDRAARGTRGVALSFASISQSQRTLSFSGVGNVDGRVFGHGAAQAEHLMPQNGIVGHTLPTLRGSTVPWPVGARLVLHSDGISARWRAEAYPGLMDAHPALMAGVIFRDFARERDDATILVLADAYAPAPGVQA